MGFQHLSKDARKKTATRGGGSRRSPALTKAWANAEKLKAEYEAGGSPSQMARDNDITVRALYRIVRGK